MKKADIVEIFSSIQGEGLGIGQRHIFVRFKGCNLNCRFCDSDRTKTGTEIADTEILNRIDEINKAYNHSTLCITGGEPLKQVSFLEQFLPKIKERGLSVYLETNSTYPEALDLIIDDIDIIAADIKLPSVAGGGPYWDEHRKFIEKAFQKQLFVKVIVSDNVEFEEFLKAVDIVRNIDFEIPFIIQPETDTEKFKLNASGALLMKLQLMALSKLSEVLVIPQAHKMLGVD